MIGKLSRHELRGLKFDTFFSNLDAKTTTHFFGGGRPGGGTVHGTARTARVSKAVNPQAKKCRGV